MRPGRVLESVVWRGWFKAAVCVGPLTHGAKQAEPSDCTLGPGWRWRAAHPRRTAFRKPLTRLMRSLWGRPSTVTSTAATNGVLPTALATAPPAPIGVHLHDARQRDALVAPTHRLHQLVLQLPGGVLADAELARQLERRDAVLGLRQQMDCQEPGGEREPRAGEERAGGEGDLVLAGVALEKLAGAQAAVATGSARPARLVDGFGALRLAAVALQEGSGLSDKPCKQQGRHSLQ